MDFNLYNRLVVHIPEQYRAMTPEEKLRFFGTDQVEYSFLHPERNAVIRFTLTERSPEHADIVSQINALHRLYERMAPGFVMGQAGQKRRDDRDFGLLTFKSNAPERDLYNALVITDLGEKSLLISFACNLQDVVQLSMPFSKLIDTMEFLPEVSEDD